MAPSLNMIPRDIAWNQVSGGGAWALNCDWVGGDLSNAKVSGDQCGSKCATTTGCTHFTWTNANGGTCWMKTGPVTASQAIAKNNDGAVCGYSKSDSGSSINWNNAADGGYWALNCDWTGGDIANAQVSGEQCGSKCATTSGCTHFTWTSASGGTCWMKGGNVSKGQAFATTKDSAVCGAVSGTAPTQTSNDPPKTTDPSSPGQTITSAWGAPPAGATRFPIIECDRTKTCYKRNTFLSPAWNFPATVQESGDMSMGLGRFYLVDPNGSIYKQFNLNNRQIVFNVDVSGVKCGQNSALYFSSMAPNVGSEYCDGQGSCMEMDIFEGNIAGTQFTTHECRSRGQVAGNQCNHDGCSAGSNTKYSDKVGPNSYINSLKPFKITTKFYTEGNSDNGALKSIVQIFEQDGKYFQTGDVNGGSCTTQWGGVPQMGVGQADGMTLILSFWEGSMDWLDGGFGNGKCNSAIGGQSQAAKYSQIRVEPIA
ncbi:hypothetical protein CcCBS67573_g04045 [Chytriomyces confervae]|uniref:Glucanase n=1 Tax=Chytriomyces confervae TaxID=246404 RepID=A0A507FEP4_9FUNG|nr:hypothetical protein HDU80_004308 [Chytriomyces hyalinus]TPX74693.1 hypothetical protein CcCBS67573_g04045 [Chytriomyces confervae]